MKKIFSFLMLTFTSLFVAAQNTGSYRVGDAVQPFSLKNVDGKTVALADYKNAKGFIVVFTCNECPYAKAYQDRILALDKKYSALDFPVVAINANDGSGADSYGKMQARAKDKSYTFPYLSDPDQVITKKFGATNTPHTFVIDKKGDGYTLRYSGAIDNDTENTNPQKISYVADAVHAVLAQKEISTTKQKPSVVALNGKRVSNAYRRFSIGRVLINSDKPAL